jgi:hypothetical protein
MNNLPRRSQQIIKLYCYFLVCLLVGLAIGIQIATIDTVNAQPTRQFNTEVLNLKNRINSLETELRKSNNNSSYQFNLPSRSSPSVAPSNSPPAEINGVLVGRSDPAFTNLATMVVELKQQVQELEKRVNKIEKSN